MSPGMGSGQAREGLPDKEVGVVKSSRSSGTHARRDPLTAGSNRCLKRKEQGCEVGSGRPRWAAPWRSWSRWLGGCSTAGQADKARGAVLASSVSPSVVPAPQAGARRPAVVMEPGSLTKERKMLLGIKQRAETLAASQSVAG